MKHRIDCALEGVALSSLDARIRPIDVQTLAPAQRLVTVDRPFGGQFLLGRTRRHLTVRVLLRIEEYSVTTRRDIWQRISAWAARGGIFTATDRPGQQLQVTCTALPALSALMWLDTLALEFTAHAIPYWEDAQPSSITITGAGVLTLPGTAEGCPVSCTVTNTGDAPLTTLSLRAGETAMTFDKLSIPAGGAFCLTDGGTLLSAAAEGESVLLRRLEESDDQLLASPGENAVSVEADGTVSAVFTARGRYL
ncbi:MAG: hypothetical protein IJ438_10560 [Clostridia bacterium]|nr:hypothetical protein [Clostridia bacterium]